MINVGGDDGAAARDFITDEFGRDQMGDRGAKGLACMLAQHPLGHFFAFGTCGAQTFDVLLAAEIFANRDKLHFRGNDPAAGVVHLRDVGTGLGAAWMAT